jgi:hypothetical protein
MLKLILRLYIALMLIAATNYSSLGQGCSGIVAKGPDTCVLIPQDFTNSANFVKAAMDAEKLTHNQLVLQVNDLKMQRDTLRAQKNLFKQTSDTCRRVNDDLVRRNANLSIENTDLKAKVTNDRIAIAVAVIIIVLETAILVF